MKGNIIFLPLLMSYCSIPLSTVLSSNCSRPENTVSLPEKIDESISSLNDPLPCTNNKKDVTNHSIKISSLRRFFLDRYCDNNFEKTLLEHNELFVDKSMFIAELMKGDSWDAKVITRPCGWGKTFNMEMVQLFFDIPHDEYGEIDHYKRDLYRSYFEGNSNITLPDNRSYSLTQPLKISQDKRAMAHAGNHPVIYVSFANGANSFEELLDNIATQIQALIERKKYARFLTPPCESTFHPDMCPKLLNISSKTPDPRGLLENSLCILSSLLRTHFRESAVVLIDDFDFPLHLMVHKKKDFDATVQFLDSLFDITFSVGFLDVFRGVATGVLQLPIPYDVSLGMDFCIQCSVFDSDFSAHFGFTETEITTLLEKNSDLPFALDDMRERFNGYFLQKNRMYIPLTTRLSLEAKKLQSCWSASCAKASNPCHESDFLAQLFMSDDYQELIQRQFTKQYEVSIVPNPEVGYESAMENEENLVSVFAALGCLTYAPCGLFMIPNKDMRDLFETKIILWTSKRAICENNEEKLDTALDLFQTKFKFGNKSEMSSSFGNLLSLIKPDVPKDFHCNVIFGLLIRKKDYWNVNRTFVTEDTYYKQTEGRHVM